MKPILYIALAGSLALGACSSTYKAAQTPDDVYYSPRQQARTYASTTGTDGSNGNSVQDENANYAQAADEDEGTYVTYQDEDQGDYQRRLNRFGSNSGYSGGYWDGYNAASNLYVNNYYGFGMMSPYSSFGYSPFYGSMWGPSLSIGLGWGFGGGYYSPWSRGYYGGGWGYPYYGHYSPYYGGGYYGGGYYGHGNRYYTSRPANSYGPVRGGNERVVNRNFTNSGGTTGNSYSRPARGSNIQPVNGGRNTGGFVNPSSTSQRPRRVFQQSNSERPVTRPSNNSSQQNSNYSRPQRVEYSRPSTPAPTYSAPSGGSRVNSGGSSGGGGYSRPARGGR
ncbi:hypothetical protein [Chitinophaga sp. MM2321]|uniref:hypothetical protein n=1 Tax=Chitinophaga sp. MM2321 TaxID=3137178 RepID=UPI0032D575ED